MCRYCKGSGRYPLLNRLVECDQCDKAPGDPGIFPPATNEDVLLAAARGGTKRLFGVSFMITKTTTEADGSVTVVVKDGLNP